MLTVSLLYELLNTRLIILFVNLILLLLLNSLHILNYVLDLIIIHFRRAGNHSFRSQDLRILFKHEGLYLRIMLLLIRQI